MPRPAAASATTASATTGPATTAGDLLREWRQRRRMSQLDLAIQANISSRHLSFVETGRAKPSSEMILHLAEELGVPLRDRNALLLAGGYAPAFAERALSEPDLSAVQSALRRVLAGHMPYPAVVVNRWWELVDANPAIGTFTKDAAPQLLAPPVNVLRLSLHPDGMAPRIGNFPEWAWHVLNAMAAELDRNPDERLAALHAELRRYVPPARTAPGHLGFAVPLELRSPYGELRLMTTITSFATAVDVTLSELKLEAFLPADQATAAALTELAGELPSGSPRTGTPVPTRLRAGRRPTRG